jgi:25S rRNA (adenine2142-N1)-methyltransferase
MPKTKKKIPVTAKKYTSSSPSSIAGRTTIRRFHVLLKRQAQLREHTSGNATALTEIEREIESLGGLDAYQRMSTVGQSDQRGGGSEKFFISWLKELQIAGMKKPHEKLRCVICLYAPEVH